MPVIKLTKNTHRIEPAKTICLYHTNINKLFLGVKDQASNNYGYGEIGEISEYFKRLSQSTIRNLYKSNWLK